MITSVSGGSSAWSRPDPAKMAEKLFSKLDTKGQGYIDQSTLETAFSQVSGADSASGSSSTDTSGADALFKKLDADGDGKVTESELSDTISSLMSQMEYMGKGMSGASGQDGSGGHGGHGGPGGPAAMGGMPPPPPPSDSSSAQDSDSGYTLDQLNSKASELSSTDSKRAAFMSELASNFDKADADGNGKITRDEAMGYARDKDGSASATASPSAAGTLSTLQSLASAGSSGNSDGSDSTGSSTTDEAALLKKIMQLMHAYEQGSTSAASGTASSSFAATA